MVRSVRRDEQEGVVIPTAYDQDTKQPLFDFSLMNSGGGRTFDTNSIIRRYEERMLMTVLADFILVGHQGQALTLCTRIRLVCSVRLSTRSLRPLLMS
jgi:hypothetical protein